MDKGNIYLIVNKINNKCYVGQAKCYNNKGYATGYKRRWITHLQEAKHRNKGCIALNSAIRKYGKDNFKVNLIYICHIDKLDYYEKLFIWLYDSLFPNGYNIRTGGKNGKHTDASRKRMRDKKLGTNNPSYGKPRTKETKKKISIAKSGSKHHFFGKNLSETHKLNLSKSHKKNNPQQLPMYLVYIKERPENYSGPGYAVLNHPSGKKKYFTSKKISMTEKYNSAMEYLHLLNNEKN